MIGERCEKADPRTRVNGYTARRANSVAVGTKGLRMTAELLVVVDSSVTVMFFRAPLLRRVVDMRGGVDVTGAKVRDWDSISRRQPGYRPTCTSQLTRLLS